MYFHGMEFIQNVHFNQLGSKGFLKVILFLTSILQVENVVNQLNVKYVHVTEDNRRVSVNMGYIYTFFV